MDDTISRAAAINEITEYEGSNVVVYISVRELRRRLENLPSAQPEIIRCKDCKWFGEEGCAVLIVDNSDKPTEDDYCSFAERREEE